MGSRTKIAVATIAAASVAVSASASEKERETPQVFKDAVACRDIADPAQRLACYDTAVGALATAEEQDDVVIASREEIRETRRGLFGLSLPKIKLFGGGDDEDKEDNDDDEKEDETEKEASPSPSKRAKKGGSKKQTPKKKAAK